MSWIDNTSLRLFCFVSDKTCKVLSSHFASRQLLLKEMRGFVDSFYLNMTTKMDSIIKEQKREVREIKAVLKHTAKNDESSKLRQSSTESNSTFSSNATVSSWTTEKQFEQNKKIGQLLSQSLQLNLPNCVDLNDSCDSLASTVSSSVSRHSSSKFHPSKIIWKHNTVGSDA